MIQLTVGYVSGIIAAGIFLAGLWSPNVLAFILFRILHDTNSAATWTVASSALQRSHWPTVLRTDTTLSSGVHRRVWLLSNLISIMAILIAVAGVVTPLGLYQTLLPGKEAQAPFKYISDDSSYGYGTPPRSNYSFSRLCGTGTLFTGPKPCPFTDTVSIISNYPNGTIDFNYPYGIDLSIPNVISETYSSGTDNSTTVSNYFDIQWRRYMTTSADLLNNGSTYLVGAFKNMESLILNNARQPVEGLVVDTIKGGVGLRNHTVPPNFRYGVIWTEDLLFIEPETVCVDTNLTLDYTIVSKNDTMINGPVLTDRGGFVKLNHSYPEYDLSDPQKNPDLHGRAYKAAWLHNALAAVYYNVTNPANTTAGTKSFTYLNSEINKTFPIHVDSLISTSGYDSLIMSLTFGDYLTNSLFDSSNSSKDQNPFDISSKNFSVINLLCSGAGNSDYANITNILVSCGEMRGVPQRQDPGSSLIFEAGSQWSQKLFACATAVKATIKTVSFSYNGTETLLSNLDVTDIQDKVYLDENSMPLWGVENTGNAYYTEDLNLVWGLVSSKYENNPNVSTARQPSLYLPGWLNPDWAGTASESTQNFENLPASDFSVGALYSVYGISGTSSSNTIDYSGQSNMAMWARWQNLTRSAETASLIPNLIFTDTSASAIVGTKGILGPGNTAQQNLAHILVTPYVQRIQYRVPFAIPAIVVLLILILATLVALVMACLSSANLTQMRLHLQRVAPGRIYTTFLNPDTNVMNMRTRDWSMRFGYMGIDLSGEFPRASDAAADPHTDPDVIVPEKGATIAAESLSSHGTSMEQKKTLLSPTAESSSE